MAPRNCRFLSLVVVKRGLRSQAELQSSRGTLQDLKVEVVMSKVVCSLAAPFEIATHIAQYLCEIVSQRGPSHPLSLVHELSCKYR